ncbi:MAG: serine/threonine protein kinase [Dehalococcoidia bacterium]|nr:serine/threonine protein kinase [Dehalococcoidia bacterium]
MINDPTPFVILAALILIAIPIIVAIVQSARKPRGRSASQGAAQARSQAAAAPPTTKLIHGRYEFKSPPFKQGGMATIWMAKERPTGRQCIIKTPRRGTTMDNVYLDKLMLEAGYLKRLKHANIVKYLHDYYSDEEFHLVLEYISGESIMASSPRISAGEQKVVGWACQLLDALSYIHAAGIIHRDVNPKNIMLCNDGAIKLIDFGTAKDLNGVNNHSLPRDPFTQIANKGFDIPELFTGSQSDQRCDLCGVAQTCIYLLTLRQPNELCSSLINTNWPRTFAEAKTIASYLITAGISIRVSRCLAQGIMFAPEHRFADVHAMQSAICPAKNGNTANPSVEAEVKK